MARTAVTTSRMVLIDAVGDMGENAVAIDQPNGMRVVIAAKVSRLAIRITNTSASPRQVTMRAPAGGSGNSKGVYGAPGPGGSNPPEPDYVMTAIPATTGVRWLAPPARYLQADGAVWLDFQAGHTGTVSAVESA